jgi:signal transduction histidine kinase
LNRSFNPDVGITEVIYGAKRVIDKEIALFSKTKSKIDTCMSHTRPTLAIGLGPIKNAFIDAKNRGVHLRYITEITKDNLSYCKKLIGIVHEMRHLDGIKGNFMVSEIEYISPLLLFEHDKISPQAIYSNIREVVEQEQYAFDGCWNKAIPAQERIKEIEEGRIIHYETRLLKNQDEINNKINNLLETSNELLVCSGLGGLQLGYDRFLDIGKKILTRFKEGKHRGIRLVTTDIGKDKLELVKTLLGMGIEIRAIKNMLPMNFSVTDKEVHATIERLKDGNIVQSVLVSNEPEYIDHFHSIFEELWSNGIEAKVRIASIEEGVDIGDIQVIPNSSAARELYLDIVKNAQKEITILFPTPNAFLRQYKIGAVESAKKAARQRNVKVKILMPHHESTEQLIRGLTEESPSSSPGIKFEVRYIEQTTQETQATFLVVDSEVSLVMEIIDDLKTTFDEGIGLSTFSSSKAGVVSYVAIFESLWKQTELYEEVKKSHELLKLHDRMQREFINIAAHELRTPIQPILGLSQILLSKTGSIEQYNELLDVINRNANRLSRLTDDILDVTKIESKTLALEKEQFNLNDIITNGMDDIMLGNNTVNSGNVQLLYQPHDIILKADKGRITQVISNLLTNAVKFTDKGTITISTRIDKDNNQAIIEVKDTGCGIDPEILPELFSKFTARSFSGTGLGLFISKSIIEAHGGKIWAENNKDGKGTTFTFSLPLPEALPPPSDSSK